MKNILIYILLAATFACTKNPHTNLLNDIEAFNTDSSVNMVVEIPAGTNQKWEVNKETGQPEWERINSDSLRIINYLPYPANYGFVPQTLLPKETGGDGDPVDVFVLGESMERSSVVKVRIIGMIEMYDTGEEDFKLVAVPFENPAISVNSINQLQHRYPGALQILKTWLANYKGEDKINITSINNAPQAIQYLKKAHQLYLQNHNIN
jgi:inorganic pyrophosphatase